MVECLGPANLFITLSCNDLNWPEIIGECLYWEDKASGPEDIEKLTFNERQRLVQRYPDVVHRHFNLRVNALFNLLRSDASLLGYKVIDFFYRIEYQQRGSPHVHSLVWLEGFPNMDYQTEAEYKEIIKSIDRVSSCSLSGLCEQDRKLVENCQRHKHKSTCRKNNQDDPDLMCRFGYPRPVSSETRYFKEMQPEQLRKNSYRKILLRRSIEEVYINAYNLPVLRLWRGMDMDVQPADKEMLLQYICKYTAKSAETEIPVTAEIQKIVQEVEAGRLDKFRGLRHDVGMKLIDNRMMSACEAASNLLRIPLRKSTRDTVFINTSKPEDRYRLLKEQDDRVVGTYNNMIDRYMMRPATAFFENLSLGEFAAWYKPYYKKKQPTDDDNDDLEDVLSDQDASQVKRQVKNHLNYRMGHHG